MMLPAVPRTVTSFVKRRAWLEPSVRALWLAALALLAVSAYFVVERTLVWSAERSLVRGGFPVAATVLSAGEYNIKNQRVTPESQVQVTYPWKGELHQSSGYIDDTVDYITIGQPIPLRVDANDPDRWTARKTTPPLLPGIFVGLLATPGYRGAFGLVAVAAAGDSLDLGQGSCPPRPS